MVSFIFNAYKTYITKELQRINQEWAHDMRDPQAIGEKIIKRAKGTSACEAADNIELYPMPKYDK